jgi:hypothetical protein
MCLTNEREQKAEQHLEIACTIERVITASAHRHLTRGAASQKAAALNVNYSTKLLGAAVGFNSSSGRQLQVLDVKRVPRLRKVERCQAVIRGVCEGNSAFSPIT